jgi:hypothetical protein
MKKVISFCLFGLNPRYVEGAVKNAELAQKYMPDWECWFYVPANYNSEILKNFEPFSNTKIIKINKPTNFIFTMYRFLVFADPTVDIAIIRDVDARISGRDILCINEWLESGLNFHVIKDHPTGHSAVMSAGMWGARAINLRNIKETIENFLNPSSELNVNRNWYGVDQAFLWERINPMILESCMYHSEYYHCKTLGNSIQKRFPSKDRYPKNHIGAALNADDTYVYSVDAAANNYQKYKYDFDLLESNN